MKHTINDGLRMIGQLLRYHGTTGWYAKDREGNRCNPEYVDATCFCFEGSIDVVARTLGLPERDLFDAASSIQGRKLKSYSEAGTWDNTTESKRARLVNKLCKISAP